jgi:integrase
LSRRIPRPAPVHGESSRHLRDPIEIKAQVGGARRARLATRYVPTPTGARIWANPIVRAAPIGLDPGERFVAICRMQHMATRRHTAAMRLLRAPTPVDTATIALCLGHETLDSTNKYLHADMELKRRALDRTTPTNGKPWPLPRTRPAPRIPREPLTSRTMLRETARSPPIHTPPHPGAT